MTTTPLPIFNTLVEAQAFVVAHPGASANYVTTIAYNSAAPLFATMAQVLAYLFANPGQTATWNQPPLTTAASLTWPPPALDLTELAADLTTLRAAVAGQASFVGVTASAAASVQTALSDCLNDTTALLADAETEMAAAPGVAGVIGGIGDVAVLMAFNAYLGIALQEPDLIDMNSFLTRMADNLAAELG